MAMLFVVQNAPELAALSDPDTIHLHHRELITVIPTGRGGARLTTTSRGKELLRRFALSTKRNILLDDETCVASESY
jgi:hypothetical protein